MFSLPAVYFALLCEARAGGAPYLSKPTHPRKFGNHVTVNLSILYTGVLSLPVLVKSLTLSKYELSKTV